MRDESPIGAPAVVSVGGEFRHDVLIGAGLLSEVGALAARAGIAPGARTLLVVDHNAQPHADAVKRSLASAGYSVASVALVADEGRKSMEAVSAIWQAALAHRLTRRDCIVAVGGGLIGDVAGFAASTYLRGVRWIGIPTTLLAMVDASTGGKTGINLPLPPDPAAPANPLHAGETLGKNLAGAFWTPAMVIADPATLRTLPIREIRSGLAECVKHAVIDGEEHLAWLEGRLDQILTGADAMAGERAGLDTLLELLRRSVAVKARVVTEDPRETAARALLNFGHTFGHALETIPALDLTHGEAVAIGMVAACRAGEALWQLDPDVARRVVSLLERIGLPARVPADVRVTIAEVTHRMGFDKKVDAGRIRFVIPRGIGALEPKVDLSQGIVEVALRSIGCEADSGENPMHDSQSRR
jgi:3-dehydroquinate synthase